MKRFPVARGLLQMGMDWTYVWYRQGERWLRRDDPLRFRHEPTSLAGSPQLSPLIFIPGVYEPWEYMKPLIELAHAWKYPVYVVEPLGYNVGNIPHMAELARRYIDDQDIRDSIIIAHSKGGLIGKYLLAYHNQDRRVRHVIALNSPFGGSLYAELAPVRNVRALSPEDRLIKELAANREVNRRITSIYNRIDPQIPEGSKLEGADNIEIDAIGHFRIVKHPQAHQAVLDTLQRLKKPNISAN